MIKKEKNIPFPSIRNTRKVGILTNNIQGDEKPSSNSNADVHKPSSKSGGNNQNPSLKENGKDSYRHKTNSMNE